MFEKQKVKISYTVELDDVPEKSKVILRDVSHRLQQITSCITAMERGSMELGMVTDSLLQLDNQRQALGLIDMLIEDYMNVLAGFHACKTNEVLSDLSLSKQSTVNDDSQ